MHFVIQATITHVRFVDSPVAALQRIYALHLILLNLASHDSSYSVVECQYTVLREWIYNLLSYNGRLWHDTHDFVLAPHSCRVDEPFCTLSNMHFTLGISSIINQLLGPHFQSHGKQELPLGDWTQRLGDGINGFAKVCKVDIGSQIRITGFVEYVDGLVFSKALLFGPANVIMISG